MSRATKEINKITGAVIAVSSRLIILALVVLLLYEGVTRGYAFGHEIFYASAMEEEPGRDKELTVAKGTSVAQTAKLLKENGLIANEYSFIIQAEFFDYKVNPGDYTFNTSMTSKEILQMMNENTGEKEEEK
ncbi:endolytic transglycosylase MltG [Lacrimispora saccharolytica]|uniref:Aminodeoxychorismate lyase n=1 Tax=Lacrimispora saccharolytica (strain ATCC 35040 / DSM 2544 / NRCC 2533 / WM1) TaxID=610130 RepID=D9R682_LACSW|nr:endolytic transglycosylase MltG [Lacrimispora saccharolytica]ADL03516.1 aminodeoxychorismate lyase [[Clostridium] saccharolyticum WM1]QRV18334.1 endolytic transglycosylase MltG [Lacrimispora saccharolytica]